VTGQITLFEQMRDAVRQVSRDKIFHSIQHRDEVLEAIILALEELEDKAAMLEGEAVEENKEWEQVLNDDQPPKLRGE
jgi:type III secretion protein W